MGYKLNESWEGRQIDPSHLWRYVVVATNGRECTWTRSETWNATLSLFLPGYPGLWPYAQEQGYRMREFEVLRPRETRGERAGEQALPA